MKMNDVDETHVQYLQTEIKEKDLHFNDANNTYITFITLTLKAL